MFILDPTSFIILVRKCGHLLKINRNRASATTTLSHKNKKLFLAVFFKFLLDSNV